MEQEYISLRNRYLPTDLKIVFVLESPPQGHGYVYNPEGRISEVLFRAFMKLIDFIPTDKNEGLQELAKRGYLLVNPVYIPVNKLPDEEADEIIVGNYNKFKKDLDLLIGVNKDIPIVLVKSNILRLLEKPMLDDGYNIVNHGLLIPFPLHYHINTFLDRTNSLISKVNSNK
ncbi:MAG: hypothetical protein QG568_678 [Patescibacteria group bacterium]|nr:hypothetical protein [Patescibacteria group bacterium]